MNLGFKHFLINFFVALVHYLYLNEILNILKTKLDLRTYQCFA